MAERTRVLIVDDSELCRASLRAGLESDPGIEVVGEAADGVTACRLAEVLHPALITMDLHMPGQGGLETIERIMRRIPTPILVVTERPTLHGEDTTFASLARGALELMVKTAPTAELCARVKALSRVEVAPASAKSASLPPARRARTRPRVVGIGASTGGPKALAQVLSSLPSTFALPVVVVQHMDIHFQESFISWLGKQCTLAVRCASDGAMLAPGVVWVAPQGLDLTVEGSGRIRLSPPAPGSRHVPSVDELFRSMASYGEQAVGVLLSGMGEDGAAGMKAMREAGALTIAQDRPTSVVYGMPRAAVEQGAVEWVLPVEQLAQALLESLGPQPEHAALSPRRKVLIVDDSEVVLGAAQLALRRAGLDVLVLSNPLAVPGVIRREKPDLVLLDVNMPAVSGEVVTKVVREHGLSGDLQVLLFSELPAAELAQRAQRCGAHGYVQKSGGTEAIVAAVCSRLA